MQFEFSTVMENVRCHIRGFGFVVVPQEKVNQRPHKHYFMEFHYVFSGEEIVKLPREGREIRLRPGQILLLPKESYHGVRTEQEAVERLCFNFSAECDEGKTSPIIRLYQSIDRAMLFEDEEIGRLIRYCRQLQQEGGSLFAESQQGLLLLSVVLRLFARNSEKHILRSPEENHELRQRWIIEEHIELHFADSTGLEGLAKSLFLSERQTRKLVQKFMGEDYKSIIVRRRMELAEIYLANREKTLEEIAWQVGYQSYSGFQLCFKRYFGISPSEKRKQLLDRIEE